MTQIRTATQHAGTRPVLSVRDLNVEFSTPDGVVKAVNGVSWDLHAGETLGIVGESGAGKTVSVLAILGLLPQPHARVTGGEVRFGGTDLLGLRERELRRIRGDDIAMVFQDPMTSLNPVLRVGRQIAEAIQAHHDVPDDRARERAVELLEVVGVPKAETRYDQWPHQFSGGMRQRALIAMAIANRPKVVLADEPTTALDVTVQAQVLDVLRAVQEHSDAATVLITHDLSVIAEMADRVVVMYAGKVVERGDVDAIFHRPRHPYTVGLLGSVPRLEQPSQRLVAIPGQPPSLIDIPPGCAFHPRCELSRGRRRCRTEVPRLYDAAGVGHVAACHFHDEVEGEIERLERATDLRIRGGAS